MTRMQTTPVGKQVQQLRKKNPSPTHFLCLPLVNPTSVTQLEASLAAFKAANPLIPAQSGPSEQGEKELPSSNIPDGSVRPLGTLHLTLGVMNLNSEERLEEALAFFRSLDLAELMREAERVANRSRPKTSLARSSKSEAEDSDMAADTPPQPFTVNLESLHALPRSKVATVLHAVPVDPTSRLYPFCIMLRDKFIEADFLHGEGEDKLQSRGEYASAREEAEFTTGASSTQMPIATAQEDFESFQSSNSCIEAVSNDQSLLEALHTGLADEAAAQQPPAQPPDIEKSSATEKLNPYAAALARHPKPRPLLLHATIVNTIYVKNSRRRKVSEEGKPRKLWPKRITIDARDLVKRYQDYYIDEDRTIARVEDGSTTTECPEEEVENNPAEDKDANDIVSSSVDSTLNTKEEKEQDEETNEDHLDSSLSTEEEKQDQDHTTAKKRKKSPPKLPFVWARDIPLELVCICEMGAKDLVAPKGGKKNPIYKRLGQKYTVVAKRSLDFTRPSPSQSPTLPASSSLSSAGEESEGSVDGGVGLH